MSRWHLSRCTSKWEQLLSINSCYFSLPSLRVCRKETLWIDWSPLFIGDQIQIKEHDMICRIRIRPEKGLRRLWRVKGEAAASPRKGFSFSFCFALDWWLPPCLKRLRVRGKRSRVDGVPEQDFGHGKSLCTLCDSRGRSVKQWGFTVLRLAELFSSWVWLKRPLFVVNSETAWQFVKVRSPTCDRSDLHFNLIHERSFSAFDGKYFDTFDGKYFDTSLT